MKSKILRIIESFLIAYGVTASVQTPIYREDYMDLMDYVTDTIYSFLGTYSFSFLLIWLLALGALLYVDREKEEKSRPGWCFLALVFAASLSLGQVIMDFGTFKTLSTSVNVLMFIMKTGGLYLLFRRLIFFLTDKIKKKDLTTDEANFFTKRSWLKSFLILSIFYGIFILLSFPGNLCYDSVGQINQVLGKAAYSTHHPLFHTIVMGGLVKLGGMMGSEKLGLFLYMLFQDAMLSAALAWTISVLSKKRLKAGVLWTVLLIYMVTPIYSNIVSTAIKDVPFIACYIAYFTCFCMALSDEGELLDKKFAAAFVLLQIGTILFRNNGLYEVLISGIVVVIQKALRGREMVSITGESESIGGESIKSGERVMELVKTALYFFVISVVVATLINTGLRIGLNAKKGSSAEMLSLPMQISARYLQVYPDGVDDADYEVIRRVMGEPAAMAAKYDPKLSDPVKACFENGAKGGDVIRYLLMVTKMCLKHPGVCLDAVWNHIYGWFTPTVTTASRYEIYEVSDMGGLAPSGIFETLRKVLIFFYRFLDRISLLGALQNVGLATWGLFAVCWYAKQDRGQSPCPTQDKGTVPLSCTPLWVGLLICFAAPGFYLHTRYGFTILMVMPFLIGYLLSKKGRAD